MASYYGQALMNIGSIIGNNMTRSIQEDERQADRLELQREREREAAERQRERLAATERENARTAELRRDLAAGRSSGGGGGGRAREYTPEEQTLMAVESGRFTSKPDVDRFNAALKTGDFSGYQVDVTRGKVTDNGDPYNPEVTLSTAKEYPPGFDKEIQSKARVLANIARESVQGKDLKDVNEGRKTGFELENMQGIVAGNVKPETFAQAQAADKGELYKNLGEAGTYNVASGANALNPLGEAKATDERAKAGKANAEAERARREPTGKNEDLATLQQMRKTAEETLKDARKALTEFDKVNTGDLSRPGREKLKEQRDALASEVTSARDALSKVSDRLTRRLDDVESSSKPTAAPKPAAAPSDSKPPDIASVQGAPAGAVIGARTDKGWEVKDKNGKLLGYIRK